MPILLGTAPDSWGVWHPNDPLQTPWHRFLDEVVIAGYRRIELGPFGYLPTDVPTLRAELARRGLTLAGATFGGALHEPAAWAGLQEQVQIVGDVVDALGGGYLVLLPPGYRDHSGALNGPKSLDGAAWDRYVETSNRLGRLVAERFNGRLRVVFHPHADSHVETAAQVERYLADTDPAFVNLCLDTGHYTYRDGDPIDLMRRHHDRIPYLHIKTVDAAVRRQVQEGDLSFSDAVQLGICAVPPAGIIDFVAFKQKLDDVGFDGYAIVEHDLYPCAFDVPLPIATQTRAYLDSVGLG